MGLVFVIDTIGLEPVVPEIQTLLESGSSSMVNVSAPVPKHAACMLVKSL